VWNVVDVIYFWSANQFQLEFCLDIVTVFCDIDDFCQRSLAAPLPALVSSAGTKKIHRSSSLALSEVMTIVVFFHASHYRTFKHFYQDQMLAQERAAFPGLPSYNRFVELIPLTLLPLCGYLQTRQGQPTGIQFIDSLPIRVCHNRRIHSHRVFAGLAQRGKGSMGWFYGFKLHLVINEQGEVLGLSLTPGNTDDRRPVAKLVRHLWGKLFGDRGYLSQELFEQLWGQGLQLITKLKRNMKNRLMPLLDKLLLRKRALIECVNDQLKNSSQIEHTRHRSATNGIVNILAAVVAYTFQAKKPALDLFTTPQSQQQLLLAAMSA
jgi:Transposase DDE domain